MLVHGYAPMTCQHVRLPRPSQRPTRQQAQVTRVSVHASSAKPAHATVQRPASLAKYAVPAPCAARCAGVLSRSSEKQEAMHARRIAAPAPLALGAVAVAAAALLTPLAADAAAAATAVTAPLQELASSVTFVPGLVGDSPLREGFVSAFLLILFSEIGDKTFFIALLLALQKDRSSVFVGTFGALAIMTVISVLLGQVFHQLDELLPAMPGNFPLDDALAVALLLFFGLQTLAGALEKESDDSEEKEAEEVVATMGSGGGATLVLSTFALVFAAEWGDKSFLATIALAAASSPAGVVAGAIAGHGVATAIAVLGGGVLGKYASEKVVQLVGGSLFLLFAAATAFDVVKGV